MTFPRSWSWTVMSEETKDRLRGSRVWQQNPTLTVQDGALSTTSSPESFRVLNSEVGR